MMKTIRTWVVLFVALALTAAPLAHATLPPVKNFAKVIVSTGYNAAATSIVLLSGHGAKLPATVDGSFPLSYWNCSDWAAPEDDPFVEIVNVTTRATDTLTVVRGFDGTSAQNHNTGGKSYCMVQSITKSMWDQIRTDIAAAGTGGLRFSGTGSPEGVVTAGAGAIYQRTDSHAGVNVHYQKTTDSGNTGWRNVPDLTSAGPIGTTSANLGNFSTLSSVSFLTTLFHMQASTLTYGSTVTIDSSLASFLVLTVTNTSAFSISNPTNGSLGRVMVLQIKNASGGVMATPSFDTDFKMASFALIKPQNGTRRTIWFYYDGASWVEIFCSPEVPN